MPYSVPVAERYSRACPAVLARTGELCEIKLVQPKVSRLGRIELIEEGYLETPYSTETFNADDVQDVFERVLRTFVLNESDEQIAKWKRTEAVTKKLFTHCFPQQEQIDALIAHSLSGALDWVRHAEGETTLEPNAVKQLLHDAITQMVHQSPAWNLSAY